VAELTPEEIRRLVSGFFGLGDNETESASLRDEVENSAAAAMEVLAQVQAVFEGAAPAGLSAEQNQAVEQRIEALIASQRRKPGLFGFLKRRPAPKPKPKAPAAAAPPPPLAAKSAPTPAPDAVQAPRGETDFEDTAPIADVPAQPLTAAPGTALAAMQALPAARSAPARPEPLAAPAPPAPKAAPKPARPAPPRKAPAKRGVLAAALALALLLGFGLYLFLAKPAGLWPLLARALPAGWLRPAAQAPAPPSAARPPQAPGAPATAAPALVAVPAGLALRSDAPAPARDAPLPAELPKATPMVAGAIGD
jgi:hypothetical protein